MPKYPLPPGDMSSGVAYPTEPGTGIPGMHKTTVNLEFFAIILFSGIGCKDIFAMFKIRGLDVIDLHQ